tara:strand:+ start:1652 stop:1807 length:156 start_codon:yes stop_codon:yes gene_type:complete
MDDLAKMRVQMIEQLQNFVLRQDSIIEALKEQKESLSAQLRMAEAQIKRLR